MFNSRRRLLGFLLLAGAQAFAQDGLLDLYPEIAAVPGALEVGGGHRLYFEECGNPRGKPVVFLHGGPGAGISPAARRFFDPHLYRIILYDQRGAGQSLSHNGNILEHNSMATLVGDLEKLRVHHGVDKWVVFGGSWGSTLALEYAASYPQHVSELILRGVFLAESADLNMYAPQLADWAHGPLFRENLFRAVLPNETEWADLTAHDFLSEMLSQLLSNEIAIRRNAVRAWLGFAEANLFAAVPQSFPNVSDVGADAAYRKVLIEAYYSAHSFFMESNPILTRQKLKALAAIRTIIVHGAEDRLVSPQSAVRLHEALPHSELFLTSRSGHSVNEPETRSRLIWATRNCAAVIGEM